MSIMGLILVAQSAAPMAATDLPSAPPPDIEIRARAEIRSLDVRSPGTARLELRAQPGDAPPVEVVRSAPAGAKRYRNLVIEIHGIARLAAPSPIAAIDTATGDSE